MVSSACIYTVYTFRQKLINQIVVVSDSFSVDSTAQASICHEIQFHVSYHLSTWVFDMCKTMM